MAELYHRKPEGLRIPQGQKSAVLYPLNQLQHVDPGAFNFHDMKYDGREWLKKRTIPTLRLKWGDTLQLSAIHPLVIRKALIKHGIDFSGQFYVIDPKTLDPTFTTVFLYSQDVNTVTPFLPEEFVDFDPADMDRYSRLSPATLEHYKEFTDRRKNPFPWYRTPHILYGGTLDVGKLDVIKV